MSCSSVSTLEISRYIHLGTQKTEGTRKRVDSIRSVVMALLRGHRAKAGAVRGRRQQKKARKEAQQQAAQQTAQAQQQPKRKPTPSIKEHGIHSREHFQHAWMLEVIRSSNP